MRIRNYQDAGDKGFQVLDSEGVVQLTFFWWEDTPGKTTYEDVLRVLPDRLKGMGFEKHTDKLQGEVVKRFGAG